MRVNNSSATGSKNVSRNPQGDDAPYVEQEWQKVARDHQHDDLEWAAAGGEAPEEWECVACKKSFKSEAAWDSHERSKKHMKEVERLKREIRRENRELGLSGEGDNDKQGHVVGIDENPAALEPPPTPPEQGGEDSDTVSEPPLETIGRAEDEIVSEATLEDRAQFQEDEVPTRDDEEDTQPPVVASASPELSKREKRRLREARKAQAAATEKGAPQVSYFVCCELCSDSRPGL